MGGFQQRPWTPTKRRGPIAAEYKSPGPACVALQSTIGNRLHKLLLIYIKIQLFENLQNLENLEQVHISKFPHLRNYCLRNVRCNRPLQLSPNAKCILFSKTLMKKLTACKGILQPIRNVSKKY